jgi:hypothetical protein
MGAEGLRVRFDEIVLDGSSEGGFLAFARDVGGERYAVRSASALDVSPGDERLVFGELRHPPPSPGVLFLSEGANALRDFASSFSGKVRVSSYDDSGRPLSPSASTPFGSLRSLSDLSGVGRRLIRRSGDSVEVGPAGRFRDPALAVATEILDACEHPSVYLLDPCADGEADAAPKILSFLFSKPGSKPFVPASSPRLPDDFSGLSEMLGTSTDALKASKASYRETDRPHDDRKRRHEWREREGRMVIRPYDPFRTSASFYSALSCSDGASLLPSGRLPPEFRNCFSAAHEAAHAVEPRRLLSMDQTTRESFADALALFAMARAGWPEDYLETVADLRLASALSSASGHSTGLACSEALRLIRSSDAAEFSSRSLSDLAVLAAETAFSASPSPEAESSRLDILRSFGIPSGRASDDESLSLIHAGLFWEGDDGDAVSVSAAEESALRTLRLGLASATRIFVDGETLRESPSAVAEVSRSYALDVAETMASWSSPLSATTFVGKERSGFPSPAPLAGGVLGAIPVMRFPGGDALSCRWRVLDEALVSAAKERLSPSFSFPSLSSSSRDGSALIPSTLKHPVLASLATRSVEDRLSAFGGLAAEEALAFLRVGDAERRFGKAGLRDLDAADEASARRREAALSILVDPSAASSPALSPRWVREALDRGASLASFDAVREPWMHSMAQAAAMATQAGTAVDPRTLRYVPPDELSKGSDRF